MNSTKGRRLTDGAEHWAATGADAMNAANWDYALECYSRAIELQPDELEFRKQKHRCSRRCFGPPDVPSNVVRVKLAAIRSRLLTTSLKNDWLIVDKLAEESLSMNPWQAESYAYLARAAQGAGRLEIARYAWTSAVKLDRENAAYYREFGGVLQQLGEYDKARQCFQRISAIDPTGRIAKELISSADVAALMDTHGYASATSSRDVVSQREQLMANSDAQIDQVAAEQSEESTRADELLTEVSRAEEHVKAGRLYSAVEIYRRIQELVPDNQTVRRRMHDVELAALRQDAFQAQQRLQRDPPNEDLARTAALRSQKLFSREREIYIERLIDQPDDLMAAFQLADVHRRGTEFHQAVPLFERAMDNTSLRAEAMIGLGECLIHIQKASVGHKYLMSALTLVSPTEKPNSFKLAHYWLGRLYEAQGYREQAEAHYGDILRVDPAFRDTQKRLEALAAA